MYLYITDRRVAGKSSSVYTSNQQDIGIICGHVDEQSSSRGPKPSTYTPIVKVIGLVKNSYFHLMFWSRNYKYCLSKRIYYSFQEVNKKGDGFTLGQVKMERSSPPLRYENLYIMIRKIYFTKLNFHFMNLLRIHHNNIIMFF